jgi:hypothetical protein
MGLGWWCAVANQPPTPPTMEVEERDDGLLFKLRDEVFMLVQWHSAKQLQVEAWRRDKLLAPDVGNLNTSSFRSKLTEAARETFGKENVPNIREDIDNVARALSTPGKGGKSLQDQLSDKARPSVAERLVLYARRGATFFHDAERQAYASVTVGGHVENYPVRSRQFKLWVQREFWVKEKQRIEDAAAEASGAMFEGNDAEVLPEVVREQSLGDAVRQLEGLAIFEGPEQEVNVRVAGDAASEIYIDLGDKDWRAVRIDRTGWEVVSDCPAKFVRPKGLIALPEPVEGGKAGQLRELLNLPNDDDGDQNWRLILAWMAQAFLPSGPYPVLVLLGPQGSAKTTAGRIIRRLIDPSTVPDRGTPKDEHNLFIEATSNWIVSIDNLSMLPSWLSDVLCRLSTSGGFSTRTLYENRDQELFEAMRPVILTGISDVVTKPDLLERAIIVNLPRIDKSSRRREKDVYRDLDNAAGEILGFLFSAISDGMGKLPEVSLDKMPRMADFATWGIATEEALGGAPDSFMKAYAGAQDEATGTALETWPIASYLWEFAKSFRGQDKAWTGTPGDLKRVIEERVSDDALKRSKEWPKTPSALSKQINRLDPSLREVGVLIERPSGSRRDGRKLQVYYVAPASDEARDGDSGDSGGDSGTEKPVTVKNPIDKPDIERGDGGDGGDSRLLAENNDEDFGEI